MKKSINLLWFFSLLSALAYFYLAYFVERQQFSKLFLGYTLLFSIYGYFLYSMERWDFKTLLGISILFRLLFIISIPELSNDFYRFIFDGRVSVAGFNPYLILPSDFLDSVNAQKVAAMSELYSGMGTLSPYNYTCYTPANMFVFIVTAVLSPDSILQSVVVMRLFIIAAEFGTIWLGYRLLKILAFNPKRIFIYALNPTVVLELTGNLHFEALMIFFLVVAFYLLQTKKIVWSAVSFGLAVSIKLIPLMFLPLLIKLLGWKGAIRYGFIVLLLNIVFFIPFIDNELYANFMSSIDLYFRKFEFNASIYYIIRFVGYKIQGWNIIQLVGPYIALAAFTFTILIARFGKNNSVQNVINSAMIVLSFYYFIGTTIMPWYITVILFLSIFTEFRYALLWSYLLIFSYQAYSHREFQENMWLMLLEYVPVYILFAVELYRNIKTRRSLIPF